MGGSVKIYEIFSFGCFLWKLILAIYLLLLLLSSFIIIGTKLQDKNEYNHFSIFLLIKTSKANSEEMTNLNVKKEDSSFQGPQYHQLPCHKYFWNYVKLSRYPRNLSNKIIITYSIPVEIPVLKIPVQYQSIKGLLI